ncbi:MAG: sulfatase [Candidatus Cyclobacteriaceae bacterium M3_2C_046]
MKKYLFIVFILLSCHLVFAQKKPNILFIAIDDLNDYVGCMNGSIKAYTPNIDRLAAQGTLFTNAHCQAPICGPSRASIMTGLYPATSGNYLQVNDPDIKKANATVAQSTFMPDYFEKNGYKTMAVGKIYHNGDAANTFDEYGGKFAWMGPKPKERFNYDPAKIPQKTGGTQTDWAPYPEHDSMMTDYKSAAWAVNKLGEDHEKPFFLAVGFVRPHVPWYAPQKWFDMFPKDKIETPPYQPNDFEDIPLMAYRVAEAPMMPTTEELIASGEWKDVMQAYLACIAFVDAQVGKVLEALEDSPYADNTIIVLWADHGYHLGEKNRFAKQAIWERDTRTVLIFKKPGQDQGQDTNAPVQLVDIYPTLTNLAGLPDYPMAQGHSLKPLLDNPSYAWPHPALSFYGVDNIAVRDQQFRLIQYEDGSQELYDMQKDPNEWVNLAYQEEFQSTIEHLQKHIPDHWAPLSPYSSYNFNTYFQQKSE